MGMSKILALILTALTITISTGARADQEGGPPVFEGNFTAAAEWVEVTWKDWKFSLPANWAPLGESGWGILDPEKKTGVAFTILVEQKHVKDMPPEKDVLLEDLGGTWAGSSPATGYLISAKEPGSEMQLKSKVLCLDEPREDGSYLVFTGIVVGLVWEDHQATLERVFASIKNSSAQ